jgi:diguanylate cyclase (GGDEF)-like protein
MEAQMNDQTEAAKATAPVRRALALWLLVAAVATTAAALFALRVRYETGRFDSSIHAPWLAIAVGFGLTAAYVIHLHFRSATNSLALDEIFLVVGLFALSPRELVLAQLVGAGVFFVWKRLSLVKFLFNSASFALQLQVAVVLFRALADTSHPLSVQSWVAALAGSLIAASLGIVVVSLAVMITEGRFRIPGLGSSVAFGVGGSVVNTMLGLVAVIVLSQSSLGWILLAGPIVVVLLAYRAYLSERSKSAGLEFLYSASEVLNSAQDIEAGLLGLLDFARETLHAEVAEILLHGDDDDTVYCTRVGPGTVQRALAPVQGVDVKAVLDAAGDLSEAVRLGSDRAGIVGAREGFACGSAMLAPLNDDAGVRGALLVGRDKASAEPFGKEELQLFETFANHLSTTLEKARLNTSLARLQKAEQELAYQAYHDSLTGLANRVLFRERADAALAEAARGGDCAVMFIDLDDFKTVNDTMGHAAGDALLVEVGNRIGRCLGDRDTAARIGGDEFAVLLRCIGHQSQVHLLANRILAALDEPIDLDGELVVPHASIGVALRAGTEDAAELMQQADVAMYTAKRNGKSRFVMYEPSMSLSVARRHQLKVGLERAVSSDEFALEYQPVADASTGAIAGTEALLRWRDPARGVMRPAEFVGVAEETGLIVPIGRAVLHDACLRAVEWSRDNPHLRMFVNLSARQLADPDIVHDVATALMRTGLDAQHLVLEMTETAMMRDIEEAKATLQALKNLGVAIAIDDFGTGFSSLSYLRELPIDMLKIAKPIIDSICDSPQDAAFVKGIIELGHVVGLQVVAEGVERVEQYVQLIDMGCDFVQGYYYARSMEPGEVSKRLREDSSALAV